MRRIGLAVALTACLVLGPFATEAQQTGRVYRLGTLTSAISSAFEEELRSLGYIEGKNILIRRRHTHGSFEAVSRLAKEVVEFRPDVVLVSNGEMARAVQRASPTVPVVVAAASDLVAQGFVRSLARPGGNVTGLHIMSGELAGKRVELLREIVPSLARLAVLVPAPTPPNTRAFASERRQTEDAGRALGVQVSVVWVRERNDLAEAFKTVTGGRHEGLFVYSNPFTFSERREIARLAVNSRVPTIYEERQFVDAGGLISYGPIVSLLYRRAAVYVDKILKGAKPADLPVEQPTTFELVINLKTAKAIGLKIPQSVLLRADQIIQ